jgi:hypothetical protein
LPVRRNPGQADIAPEEIAGAHGGTNIHHYRPGGPEQAGLLTPSSRLLPCGVVQF